VKIVFTKPRYYRGKWYAANTEAEVADQYGRAFIRCGAAVPLALAPRRKTVATKPITPTVASDTYTVKLPEVKAPDYEALSFAELQKLAKKRELSGGGSRKAIIQRLLEADAK